jgi:hypothetical protein
MPATAVAPLAPARHGDHSNNANAIALIWNHGTVQSKDLKIFDRERSRAPRLLRVVAMP